MGSAVEKGSTLIEEEKTGDSLIKSPFNGGQYLEIIRRQGGLRDLIASGCTPYFVQLSKDRYRLIFPRTGGEIKRLNTPGRVPIYYTEVIIGGTVVRYQCAYTTVSTEFAEKIVLELAEIFNK